MLVLTRRKDQSLVIWHNNTRWAVTVTESPREETVSVSVTSSYGDLNRAAEERSMVLRRDESVDLGEQITVSVVDIREDRVRLGINAPGSASVDRLEFLETMHRRSSDDDDAGGTSSAAVPRPKRPPSSSPGRALEEPEPDDEGERQE